MAKNDASQTPRRQTRKEVLLTRRQQQQYRQVRLAVMALVGFILVVLAIGLTFEYIIKPNQPVASVESTEIALNDWQQRVRFERAQLIDTVDALYEAVGQDVNQLSQFAGGQLQALLIPEVLGEQVLFQMIDEELIRQEAANRGIEVSDAEVQAAIEEQYNFFGGGLPTPTPTATATPIPTPSITPIPQGVGTDSETVEPTLEPTAPPTPAPTSTVVSLEAFEELLDEQIAQIEEFGADEAFFRTQVRMSLLREQLQEALADGEELTTEEEVASLFYIAFPDASQAEAAAARIESGESDFLTVWNEIRSSERLTITQPFASEFPLTPLATISQTFGTEAFAAVESLESGEVSDVLAGNNQQFLLLQLRERKLQPVSESRLDSQKAEVLNAWLEEKRQEARIFERWVDSVPTRPVLDPKYYSDPSVVPVDVDTSSEGADQP